MTLLRKINTDKLEYFGVLYNLLHSGTCVPVSYAHRDFNNVIDELRVAE